MSCHRRCRRNAISALAAAVVLAVSCDSSNAEGRSTDPIPLSSDRVGTLPITSTRARLAEHSRLVRDTIELGAEAIPESVAVLLVDGDTVRAVIDSGRIFRLLLHSPRFRTADSLGPGSRLERLLAEPGVYAFIGEGAVFVRVPHHCGLSFQLADAATDATHATWPDSVGLDALRTLPPSTIVSDVLVTRCTR